jgi:hypothetical protein
MPFVFWKNGISGETAGGKWLKLPLKCFAEWLTPSPPLNVNILLIHV